MMVLLGTGFAIYWSTMNALVQEIVLHEAMPGHAADEPPRGRLATANTGVLIAVQGGMMLAGALVGFLYDRIHLSGVLALDGATYLTSALCIVLLIRRGYAAHAARPHAPATAPSAPAAGAAGNGTEDPILPDIVDPGLVARFTADLREGLRYLATQPRVLGLGFTHACMMAGVISGHVVLVVLASDVLHAGAEGYGYLEFGWALGAIIGGFTTAWVTQKLRGPFLLIAALTILAVGHASFPYVQLLGLSVAMNALFGACRAYGGVITQTGIMSVVPHRLMGRTQSAFAVLSTLLQVAMSFSLGYVAQNFSVYAGFALLGAMYAAGAVAAWRARSLGLAAAQSPA
jgi:MFS family permease